MDSSPLELWLSHDSCPILRPDPKGTHMSSDYTKRVREEAKTFFGTIREEFLGDSGEHGGGSSIPNLTQWLDSNRKLFDYLDGVSKDWNKIEAESINTSSRNGVKFGNPKESAYFAYYKDVLLEAKKLAKARS